MGDNMENFINDPIDLCVPIYLDQQVVFDLLAMFENGFSQVTSVNTSTKDTKTNSSKGGISFSDPLSFFGISAFVEAKKEGSEEKELIHSEERIHTPSSLFSKLRRTLREKEFISSMNTNYEFTSLKCGDFVEFRSNLMTNPLIDSLVRMVDKKSQ